MNRHRFDIFKIMNDNLMKVFDKINKFLFFYFIFFFSLICDMGRV